MHGLTAAHGWKLTAVSISYAALVCASQTVQSSVAISGPASAIYVSPHGSDANPGTIAAPLLSLTRAAEVAREREAASPSALIIFVESGTYRLSQPLHLGPKDSGSTRDPIQWTGLGTEPTILSGAEQITGWRLQDPTKNVWAASIPPTLQTRQLYVNGVRAQLASGLLPVTVRPTQNGFITSSNAMARWRNPGEIEFGFVAELGYMSEQLCPISTIRGDAITMAEPCWSNTAHRKWNLAATSALRGPTFVENAFELLRYPGQFYLDSMKHVIYYMPRPGENMTTADVEAPVLQTLLRVIGTGTQTISNVSFSNLEFAYATWMQPASNQGFSEVQAGYTLTGNNAGQTEGLCQLQAHGTCPYGSWTKEPGAVAVRYDHGIMFTGDTFVHLGAAALDIQDGSHDATVQNSVFTDISGNGIEAGSVDLPNPLPKAQTTNIHIENNHLYGFPVEFYGGVPILVGYVSNSVISHNQIDHVPYSGISIGWGGWPDKIRQPPESNSSHDNVISENLIFSFLNTLSDGAGIYTNGVTGPSFGQGERVTRNVLYGQEDWGRSMQSDDGAAYVTYTNNVVYDAPYAWDCTHIGRDCAPQLVKDNYWQQLYPNTRAGNASLSGNMIISGPQDAPAAIVADAGIQPQFQSILSRPDPAQGPPGPPALPYVFDAFQHKTLITWHPTLQLGGTPLLSYTVQPCLIKASGACVNLHPVSIPASEFDRVAYAEVDGLTAGKTYEYTVFAANQFGSSTPSLSITATVGSSRPGRPGKAQHFKAMVGLHAVGLDWSPPKSATHDRNPVLDYVVTCSNGSTQNVTGIGQLLPINAGTRRDAVFGDLDPSKSYTFTITPIGVSGAGPTSAPVWLSKGKFGRSPN